MRVFAILSFCIAAASVSAQSSKDHVITPSAVHALLGKDTTHVYLDVRTPAEFDGPSGHVPGSFLIPVQELEARLGELKQYKGKTIIAICRSGNRSGYATAMLREHGFTALNMVGGMIRWNAEGLPAQHTEKK
jgi:rhodanese-related sulfurtransferase